MPSAAGAQSLTSPSDPSFLVAGMAQTQNRSVHSQGFGIGVKGGFLYSTLSQSQRLLQEQQRRSWPVLRRYRTGAFGVMGEVLYAKKVGLDERPDAEQLLPGNPDPDAYQHRLFQQEHQRHRLYDRRTGVRRVAEVGPRRPRRQSKCTKVSISASSAAQALKSPGSLIEGRYNWGLRNVLKSAGGTSRRSEDTLVRGARGSAVQLGREGLGPARPGRVRRAGKVRTAEHPTDWKTGKARRARRSGLTNN